MTLLSLARRSAICPHCHSIDFRVVGVRNSVEEWLSWLLRPCKCGLCGRYFLLFYWQTLALE